MEEHGRNIEIPSGSAHDIALMAYRIAERAMTSIERHERICSERWELQRETLEKVRVLAASNFEAGAADRKEIRDSLEALKAKATSIATRAAFWLLTTMAGSLFGAIWFIATHKWV